MTDDIVLLARQPIYDASLNVVAFELLYRSTDSNIAIVGDGNLASSAVMLQAFGTVGILNVTEGKPAFINFTPHLIINPPPIDPDHLIIEILETVKVTPEIIEGVRKLRAQGYRIALDDFEHHPDLVPLVELADIIKLDVLLLDEQALRKEVRRLRNYPLRLLGEKIESWEMYNECVDLGFSYFQGFFLAKPQLVRGRRMSPNKHAIIRLLSQLSQPDVEVAALAQTIATDPTLSFQTIKLVNSPLYRPARPIESLRDAIVYCGLERIRGWCLLMTMGKAGGKPRELARISLARARLCETLGTIVNQGSAQRYFTLGILSTLDAYLDEELVEIVKQLRLGDEMNAALLTGDGTMGTVLKASMAFEAGLWDALPWQALAALGIDKAEMEHAYLDSLQWAGATFSEMNSMGG